MILLPSFDVALNRVVRQVGPVLLAQPLPDALGGMALLVPVALVFLEPAVDDARVSIHHRRPLLLHRQ